MKPTLLASFSLNLKSLAFVFCCIFLFPDSRPTVRGLHFLPQCHWPEKATNGGLASENKENEVAKVTAAAHTHRAVQELQQYALIGGYKTKQKK